MGKRKAANPDQGSDAVSVEADTKADEELKALRNELADVKAQLEAYTAMPSADVSDLDDLSAETVRFFKISRAISPVVCQAIDDEGPGMSIDTGMIAKAIIKLMDDESLYAEILRQDFRQLNKPTGLLRGGVGHVNSEEAVEAWAAHKETVAALQAKINHLEAEKRHYHSVCAHCECLLRQPDGPPHCYDCHLDDEDCEKWEDADPKYRESYP